MSTCIQHPAVTEGLVPCARCGQAFCPNCLVRMGGASYCLACKSEQVRDLQSGTTEELELATVSRRFGALWLDSMLFGIVGFGGMLAAMPLAIRFAPKDWAGVVAIVVVVVFFALIIAYEALMLKARGQTLGKMALGIRVVTPEGNELSTGQAWGRAVLRQVFFSYLSLINYLPAVFTKQRTCIHDLALKTRVVRVRN